MNRTGYAVACAVFASFSSVAFTFILVLLHRLYSMRHLGAEAFGSFAAGIYLPLFFVAFLTAACVAGCSWAFHKAVGNSKVEPPSFF
ncbi:hypothetical protein LU11_gp045 [Pseudomonas phage Lu11]|uniref:hypothetical protein n=1 Tax=Pseudomonas phage Lu11 TaxID=1161927 RepID=UPI00025F1507|nr:hypothetical protein LU11_gp045 [Pseudomonas phage Lu11]AFH14576.1 hypothetical protein Lu11_0045 [Pseudomonas phage Lu11]